MQIQLKSMCVNLYVHTSAHFPATLIGVLEVGNGCLSRFSTSAATLGRVRSCFWAQRGSSLMLNRKSGSSLETSVQRREPRINTHSILLLLTTATACARSCILTCGGGRGNRTRAGHCGLDTVCFPPNNRFLWFWAVGWRFAQLHQAVVYPLGQAH